MPMPDRADSLSIPNIAHPTWSPCRACPDGDADWVGLGSSSDHRPPSGRRSQLIPAGSGCPLPAASPPSRSFHPMRSLFLATALLLAGVSQAQSCGTLAVTGTGAAGTQLTVALTGATANGFALIAVAENTGT